MRPLKTSAAKKAADGAAIKRRQAYRNARQLAQNSAQLICENTIVFNARVGRVKSTKYADFDRLASRACQNVVGVSRHGCCGTNVIDHRDYQRQSRFSADLQRLELPEPLHWGLRPGTSLTQTSNRLKRTDFRNRGARLSFSHPHQNGCGKDGRRSWVRPPYFPSCSTNEIPEVIKTLAQHSFVQKAKAPVIDGAMVSLLFIFCGRCIIGNVGDLIFCSFRKGKRNSNVRPKMPIWNNRIPWVSGGFRELLCTYYH